MRIATLLLVVLCCPAAAESLSADASQECVLARNIHVPTDAYLMSLSRRQRRAMAVQLDADAATIGECIRLQAVERVRNLVTVTRDPPPSTAK
jgi:hypothetical protein